jgi:serine phosphatase RsbU (regulator of sigma subunit)
MGPKGKAHMAQLGNKITGGFSQAIFAAALLSLFISLSVKPTNSAAANTLFVERGAIDLSGVDFVRGGAVALRGDWDFYWHELLTPAQISGRSPSAVYYQVPQVWRHGKAGAATLGDFGFATYRARVALPPGTKQVGLQLPYFYGWSKIYLNGEKVRELGHYNPEIPATDSGGNKLLLIQQVPSGKLEIVIQTANFTVTHGGILGDMMIGDPDQMSRGQAFRVGFDMFIISTLIFTAFYHLWMYIFRRFESSNLWFALFSSIIALRVVFVGEGQLGVTFLDLSGLWSWRLELATYFVAIPVLAKFITCMYPEECRRWPVMLSVLVVTPATILTLLTNPPTFAYARMITQLMNIVLVVEYSRAIVTSIRNKRDGSKLFLAGFAVIAGLSVFEIAALNLGLDIPRMSPIGMYLFVGFQSIQLARRFNAAFLAVESRERDIIKLNHELREQEATRVELTKISAERRALQVSLAEAQEVYRSLGQEVRGIPGLDIMSEYQPAEISGGDWIGTNYDEEQRRLYVVLADVTGHDLLSALVSIATAGGFKGAISAIKAHHKSADMKSVLEIIANVLNSAVRDSGDTDNRLMTAAILGIEIDTGRVAYLNAGHTPMLHVSGERIGAVIPPANPFGLKPTARYGSVEVQLKVGDGLFLHTDGLFDNVGPGGQKFKFRDLRQILVQSETADQVLNQLRTVTKVLWGQQKPKDDCTFVFIRWLGLGAQGRQDESA